MLTFSNQINQAIPNKPKILMKVGKTDKLIRDYLEIYEEFHKY